MIRIAALLAQIAMRWRAIVPMLGRFLRSSTVLVSVARGLKFLMTNPAGWIALVLTSTLFPSIVGSITQLVGIGLIKLAIISFRLLSNIISSNTNLNTDYTSLNNELGNAIEGLPPQMLAIMGQLGIVSLLGTIFLTMVTVATMFTIASVVKRY